MIYAEYNEQVAFFNWCRKSSIPELKCFDVTTTKLNKKEVSVTKTFAELNIYSNGNTQRLNMIQSSRHKKSGSALGVPDVFFPKPKKGYHGLFIEFKKPAARPKTARGKGGLSSAQVTRIAQLRADGYCVEIAYTCQDAITFLLSYLS